MALSQTPWTISKEDFEAATALRPWSRSLFDQIVNAEREYLNEGIRLALGLWVSELEPELMFRAGQTRPFGVTARGHGAPYIEIRWDENFYLTGDPRRYYVRVKSPEEKARHPEPRGTMGFGWRAFARDLKGSGPKGRD